MLRLPRLMLSCLMVAILSIALVGTAWYGAARAGTPAPHAHGVSSDHPHMGQTQAGHPHAIQHRAGHKHAAPGDAQAGQGCHPACTVAVIPSPVGTTLADRLSAPLRLSRDRQPVPAALSGFDRPPKHA